MSDLKTLLFEDPTPLYWLCGIVLLVWAVITYRVRKHWSNLLGAAPVIVAIMVMTLSILVTTETERLMTATTNLIDAAQEGDTEAMASRVDASYDDGVYDAATVVAKVGEVHQAFGVTDLDLSQREVNVDGDEGLVAFKVNVHAEHPLMGPVDWPTRWRLWWRLRDGQWRLVSSAMDEPAGISDAPRGP